MEENSWLPKHKKKKKENYGVLYGWTDLKGVSLWEIAVLVKGRKESKTRKDQ